MLTVVVMAAAMLTVAVFSLTDCHFILKSSVITCPFMADVSQSEP